MAPACFCVILGKTQYVLCPQAGLILFLAPFDPLLSGRKMIYITMETPIVSTKYSSPKCQIQKNPTFYEPSPQMLLTCFSSVT